MNKIYKSFLVFTLFFYFQSSSAQAPITDLQSVKNLYTTTGIKLPNTILSGVIISDTVNKNLSKGNAIFQCGSVGISLYTGTNVYSVGDSINIDLTGDSLIMYKGALEIKRKKNAVNPAPVATGVMIVPKVMTIQDIITNIATAQCTLVTILGGTASPAGTYSGAKTLTDASGSFTLYTATGATFAGSTMPTASQDWTGYTVVFNTTNEFQIRSLNDVVPLPLTFKSFVAEKVNQEVNLTWVTLEEVNTNHFVIERSINGTNFTEVNQVKSNGKSYNKYTFTDRTNTVGTIYYRLKSVDNDGKYQYSSVQKVSFQSNGPISIYPNPTVDILNVTHGLNQANRIAKIINQNGQLVKQVTLSTNKSSTSIDIRSLAKGVYSIVVLNENANNSTLSFIKQ